jgi:hypothetical protein
VKSTKMPYGVAKMPDASKKDKKPVLPKPDKKLVGTEQRKPGAGTTTTRRG